MLAFGVFGGIAVAAGTHGLMAASTTNSVSRWYPSPPERPAEKREVPSRSFASLSQRPWPALIGLFILPVETVPDLLPHSRETVSSRITLTNSSLEAVPAQMGGVNLGR
jgi:hypothetical protein